MKKHRLSTSLPIQIPKAAFSLRTGGASMLLNNGGPSSSRPESRENFDLQRNNNNSIRIGNTLIERQRGRSGSTTADLQMQRSRSSSREVLSPRDRSFSDLSSSIKKGNVVGRTSTSTVTAKDPTLEPDKGLKPDDDEPDDSQFVPPHTLTQEPFWSFAKVKYVAAEQDSKRRHSIAGGQIVNSNEGFHIATRSQRTGSDAGMTLRPNLRANLAGLPAPSLNNSNTNSDSNSSSRNPLGIGIRAQPPYNSTPGGSLLISRNSLQSTLTRALSSTSTTASTSTASSRTESPN
jgi:hypothetical protein